ncbi:TPA: ead/Ea22-like family protein [Citrobacter freundii]|nr:ead/Ea22-like family protein [Citrobacter freundii]HAT3962962.1 ead/Ea22-like family protein [Citrobacter freundii]HCC6093114.1 ead/Ea22-like family protein [Citrobacter freundii]HCQ7277389.1 ead/Ea22-like family protein [Citrobacter freundii]
MTALNKQALREMAERAASDSWGYDCDEFNDAITPEVVLALLDELEAAEKRIAELEAREIKPAKGEVLVVVSGFTGCGKSAIAGEIEIAMKAIGVPVRWTNGDAEKRMTGADWLTAIEMYKPTVRIVEVNVPRAAGIGVKGE